MKCKTIHKKQQKRYIRGRADYVLNITFSADLAIMEAGTEFLRRILSGEGALPQFTSCCTAWVSFVEHLIVCLERAALQE